MSAGLYEALKRCVVGTCKASDLYKENGDTTVLHEAGCRLWVRWGLV